MEDQAPLDKWEYMSVLLTWDPDQSVWAFQTPYGTYASPDENMGGALNMMGEGGWEAISFTPDAYSMADATRFYSSPLANGRGLFEHPGGYPTAWAVVRYRVLLKRRKQ